jgi:lysophospholipase L1-like esterase
MFGSVSQRRASAIPEARKQWNHQAFLALLTIASQDGCQILVYKPPHRPSEGPFYHDREAYDAYFEGVGQMLETMPQTHFLDLERLVPAEFWGVTNWGRPDVFHFTVEGHKRLAGAIETFFREQLTGAANAVQ